MLTRRDLLNAAALAGGVAAFGGLGSLAQSVRADRVADGGDGLTRVAQHAVLNANWLRHRLRAILPAAYDRVCMHECTLKATDLKAKFGVRGLDVAKALLEEGFHAPTVYFPLIVEEALMFEPTETESVQTLEALAQAIERIAQRAQDDPESLHRAPQSTPVSRVDEARAARHLIATADAER